jgi:hypothetical protein
MLLDVHVSLIIVSHVIPIKPYHSVHGEIPLAAFKTIISQDFDA